MYTVTPKGTVQPRDVELAAAFCRDTLAPVQASADWEQLAAGLEWTCRWTLEHTTRALDSYAQRLALRATSRTMVPNPPVLFPLATPAELLALLEGRAAVLARVAEAMPPEARGWHPMGMSDAASSVGMGCVETLVHTDDIARALGQPCEPPADLCRRVVARMFPWAPANAAPWDALRWATGRLDLPGHGRLDGETWMWLNAPLSEWNGELLVWTGAG